MYIYIHIDKQWVRNYSIFSVTWSLREVIKHLFGFVKIQIRKTYLIQSRNINLSTNTYL